MKKMVTVLLLMIVLWIGCKIPTTSEPPKKQYDIVEFMYVRVLPIINPSAPDPSSPTIFSDEFGGMNYRPPWNSVSTGVWQMEMQLKYSSQAYHVYTIDTKVTSVYMAVAEDIYVRIKGAQDWLKLPVSTNGKEEGKWASFYLDSNGID